jgi:hypothetical protein
VKPDPYLTWLDLDDLARTDGSRRPARNLRIVG